jgi:hypothetical protein
MSKYFKIWAVVVIQWTYTFRSVCVLLERNIVGVYQNTRGKFSSNLQNINIDCLGYYFHTHIRVACELFVVLWLLPNSQASKKNL